MLVIRQCYKIMAAFIVYSCLTSWFLVLQTSTVLEQETKW